MIYLKVTDNLPLGGMREMKCERCDDHTSALEVMQALGRSDVIFMQCMVDGLVNTIAISLLGSEKCGDFFVIRVRHFIEGSKSKAIEQKTAMLMIDPMGAAFMKTDKYHGRAVG